jgi:hypothetical protein
MTMYLVTRYRIEQADKYLGANGFTTDIEDCFEYRSESEANGDADEFGGEVVECKRFSNIPY